jgi:hypothetical protein
MTSEKQDSAPGNEQFLDAVSELIKPLGWQLQHFTRDQELVALVPTENDPSFEQLIWVYDTDGVFFRCLLVSRAVVPPEREPAILELCARMNDGLNFGCAEYSFDDQTIVFRNSVDLRTCSPLAQVVSDATSRVLGLGRRYAVAIEATLAGDKPEDAVKKAEAA